MHFSTTNPDEILRTAAALTRSAGWMKDAKPVAAEVNGITVAVAVFQCLTEDAADLHFAMLPGRRMIPGVVRGLCDLAFHPRFLNLPRLWIQIDDENVQAQVAALKLGAKFEHRKRAGNATGRDAIVFSLDRRDAIRAPVRPQLKPAISGEV